MLLIRDIMYCKPGKVRPLVEKFVAMNKLSVTKGMPKMRIRSLEGPHEQLDEPVRDHRIDRQVSEDSRLHTVRHLSPFSFPS